jgi:predicted PurR-regulated permease PerM
MNKKKIYKTLAVVAGISVVVLLAWYFKFITCCIVLAIILSLIGNPLMQMFQRIRIGKVRMGKNISAISTLLIILGVLFMLLYWFFPMLFSQAIQLASMDTTT